jgi:hypothetical protein
MVGRSLWLTLELFFNCRCYCFTRWHKVDAKQFLELGLRDIRDRLGIRDPADVANVLNCIQILRGTTLPCATGAPTAGAAAATGAGAGAGTTDRNKK